MARKSRFYLERLTKSGILDDAGVLEAIVSPSSIQTRKFAWTITSPVQGEVAANGAVTAFAGGHLAKYDPDAVVEVIDPRTSTVAIRSEPNLQIASSQFVFLPEYATIAHRHIWNKITAHDFRDRFASLVRSRHRDFFVECELSPITDHRRFFQKITELESLSEIKATVKPPNPLFGPLWRDFSKYVRTRNADSVTIDERASPQKQLNSDLPAIVAEATGKADAMPDASRNAPLPIGDAAVLMAADGYGRGEITGIHNGASVVIRTSDDAVLLRLPADTPIPVLAEQTLRRVLQLNEERNLSHHEDT